jgi:hypothetical protein
MFTLEKGKTVDGPKDLLFGLTNNGEDIPATQTISIVLFKKEAVIESLRFDIKAKLFDIKSACVKAINKTEADSMVVTIFTKDFNKKPMIKRANLLVEDLIELTHVRDALYLSQANYGYDSKTLWGSYMCSDTDCCPIQGKEIILAEGFLNS